MTGARLAPLRGAPGTWWVVFTRELRDLWIGGKALAMILVYCLLLGILTYLFSSNFELRLLPQNEMMLEIVKAAIAAGAFMCLIIGADSVSGERERATLEALLLTPTTRRQLALGKLLAALSPWPVAAAVAVPYWLVLSQGDPAFSQLMRWGVVSGTLLAVAFAGVGMLVSMRCNSNKTSLLVSLGIYIGLLLPAVAGLNTVYRAPAMQLRADMLQWLNPVAAAFRALHQSVLQQAPPAQVGVWLTMPVVCGVVVVAVLLGVAGRPIPLYAASGGSRWLRTRRPSRPKAHPKVTTPLLSDPMSERARPSTIAGPPPRVASGELLPGPGALAWRLVCARELKELWIGGRALMLLLVYTVVVGVVSFLSVSSSQLDLIPPKEMVFSILQISMYVGVLMGVIVGADSLSGARERSVLEPLLLTPASRRQIVAGKFLASTSPWPAALLVSLPCLAVLAQGDAVLGPALLWFTFVGSLLVVGFTGLAMLVSFWCNSNRTSLFTNLTVYFVFLLPALLPGHAQKGLVGKFFQRVNPLAAADEFLEKIVVNNRTLASFGSWLKSPVAFPIIVMALLLLYAAPRLRMEAGRARTNRS